jgi:1-acyl-sn-glycerol-3-phosphate acyltransferase
MSKREKIDQWSLLYRILKFFPVGPAHNMYYRKIQIQHADRIPEGEPVIIAPNHQNALMDAMAFVIGLKYQTVFLARADIFKSKLVIDLLTFLKIMPVYRIRDGISSLQKNDEIFDLTVNVLRNKINPLCLFPEGNHGDKRRLRPLVKGIFRIAFKAQEDYGTKPGIKIIPVGIDYSHYQKFRQTQLINFGEPIEVCEYWKDFEENPGRAMNKLRDRLSGELKKVMIDIVSEDYYDMYMGLRKLCNKTFCDKLGKKQGNLMMNFLSIRNDCRSRSLLEREPTRIQQLSLLYKEYSTLKEKLNLRDWVAEQKAILC